MSVKRVAVVTGSNKGIGFSIVKGLCKSFDGIVYLTGKNEFYIKLYEIYDSKIDFCFKF